MSDAADLARLLRPADGPGVGDAHATRVRPRAACAACHAASPRLAALLEVRQHALGARNGRARLPPIPQGVRETANSEFEFTFLQ